MLLFIKKHSLIFVLAIAAAMLLCGCNVVAPKKIESVSYSSSTKEEIKTPIGKIYKINTTVNFEGFSKTLKELYDNSQFVAEIKVGKTEARIDKDGTITTFFKPEVVTAFKGSYHGENIKVMGGVADYKDYKEKVDPKYQQKDIPDKVEYHFGKVPIVSEGDTIVVFCSINGSEFSITHKIEGIFKVDGNALKNDSIKGTNLYKDIIKATGETSSKEIPKSEFIKEIETLK